ncbi:MAG: histidine--tRNA ligase [Candidatus Paceibacterota bacterium]|jgi:histidyl-tRNA synthetase
MSKTKQGENSDGASKQKISTEPYKGVRDFYPADMAVQTYIFNTMRKVAESFGYSEYGASVLEPADLYRAKSGEEIVNEQTYTFKDKGDRDVSLRPEMTPTLARMIAGKLKEFSFPLRWYSIPNLFRYEQPQKGRTREHWQLNVDIFGVKNINADVEVIAMASDIMKAFGLKDTDFEIRINSRKIVNYILNDVFALSPEVTQRVSKLIDKKEKMDAKEFKAGIQEFIPERSSEFLTLIDSKNFEEFISKLPKTASEQEDVAEIKELIERLEKLGITNTVFSQSLMRGFDYYTGIIFEVFSTSQENRRAIFGGGRYDDLLDIFGKEKVPAVGFGMGDVVIRDVLETFKLLPEIKAVADLYICTFNDDSIGYAQDLAQKLRNSGLKVSVDYSNKKVGDQIKYADKNKIPYIVCIGDEEVKTGKLKLKELKTGNEVQTTDSDITKEMKR